MKVIVPNSTFLPSTVTRNSVGTYFDSSGTLRDAAINEVRINWEPSNTPPTPTGVLIEPEVTNFLLNSDTLSTQTRNLSSGTYTLSCYGNGTITVSGAGSYVLSTDATSYWKRVSLSFVVTGTVPVTFTVAGVIRYAQCENNSYATSWVRTTSTVATRAADIVSNPGVFYNEFPDFPNWQSVLTYKPDDLVRHNSNVYRATISSKGLDPTVATYAWVNCSATITWTPSHTYAVGDLARSNYAIFKSKTVSNTANVPEIDVVNWQYLRSDNYSSCFNRSNTIRSIGNGNFVQVCLKIDENVDSVAVLGVTADTAHVSINKNKGSKISNQTLTILGYNTSIGGSAAVTGLEAGDIVSILFTLLATDKNPVAQVGEIVIGTARELGLTQYGLEVSIRDFSKKDTDENGNTIFVKQAFSKKMNANVFVQNENFNGVVETLAELTAEPCAWIATPDSRFTQGAIIYGFIKDFRLVVEYPTNSLCSLEIEGLI